MAKYLRRSFRRKKEVRFLGNVEHEEGECSLPRYRPDGIDALCKATGFSRKELQLMYRSFKQECPTGTVNEATFKRIYTHFFPYGDVSAYAHYVFRAFDVSHNGVINFEELVLGVSALSRGSVSDKLRWVFTLYDANGDGTISRQELRDVVSAVHRLTSHGSCNQPIFHLPIDPSWVFSPYLMFLHLFVSTLHSSSQFIVHRSSHLS